MNAEAKFVSSVMDARLKKAKRERDAYKKQRDELIQDIAKLRENNANLEKVANRFDLVKENIREELDNYSVLYKDTKNPSYSLLSGVYEDLFNYIEELERGSDVSRYR
ncbi:hypothetical protein [Staphylococcus hominis]|uniref:hypothetical protein n=1 Tax=Staphylococcus hominis TaxID=1290 RepID=UPI000778C178|nr:hypothetical protein [Staphylococcus hominis]OAW28330.1 hypothetical protein A7I03_10845 [Staphylococcus hominis]